MHRKKHFFHQHYWVLSHARTLFLVLMSWLRKAVFWLAGAFWPYYWVTGSWYHRFFYLSLIKSRTQEDIVKIKVSALTHITTNTTKCNTTVYELHNRLKNCDSHPIQYALEMLSWTFVMFPIKFLRTDIKKHVCDSKLYLC